MAKAAARALGDQDYQLTTVDDLTAGVDLRHSTTLIQPDHARIQRNVSLSEPGAWQPFPGWRTRSTTNLAVARMQGARRIYLANTAPFLLAAYSGAIYQPSDVGVWGAAVTGGRSTTNEIFFVYDRTMVAIFDGQNVPIKSVNGTTWTRMGITPPAAPTLAAIAGTSLVPGDTYEVAISFGDNSLSFESNGSPSATLSPGGTNKGIRVTVPTTSTDPQVTTVFIYARDITAGESVLRRAGSVPLGTATFDLLTNNWFPNGLEIATRNTVPTAYSFGLVWRNRWWARDATVTNRIHFTEVFLPQSWPTTYYMDIPFEKGDQITAMVALGDTLVVFGNTGVYLVIGQTSLDFEVRPSSGAVAGALGPRAVAIVEQGVVHAAPGGAYIFDGASDRLLSDYINVAWNDLLFGATPADLQRVAVVYHEPRKEVRIAVTRLYDIETPGEWVLDLSRTRQEQDEAWTATTRSIGGYIPWDGRELTTGNQNRLWAWKLTRVELTEEALVGQGEDGQPMVSYYEGPALLPAPRRTARFVDWFADYKPASGTLQVQVWVDDLLVDAFTPIINGAVALYDDVDLYDSALYSGAQRDSTTAMLSCRAEGKAVTVRLTYTGTDNFKLFTYAIGTVPEPQPRGFN